MRRRRSVGEMSTDLLRFEGFRYRTQGAWVAAFAEFHAAREERADVHPGAVLAPYEVDGYCPFDPKRFQKTTG